jgi:predicted HNH restriction endonuclease
VWGWGRENRAAKKRAKGKCEQCGVEGKTNAHHILGLDWRPFKEFIEKLFCPPEDLICLCDKCHKAIHKGETHEHSKRHN